MKNKNSSVVVKAKQFENLRPILKKWIEVQTSYSKQEDWKDSIWWCNERANVGAVAAAVWLSGGTALEEYSTRKLHKRGDSSGRCDLFLRTRGGKAYACEAKHLWHPAGIGLAEERQAIKHCLEAATNDAGKLHPDEGQKLAICFVVLSLSPKFKPALTETRIVEFVKSLKLQEADAMAWCFPPQARGLFWKRNGRRFPGIAMLIRKVKSSKS